jgi:hypothetical protein
MLGAAFERQPNATMQAVRDVVLDFQMPGHSIDGFTRKSVQIAIREMVQAFRDGRLKDEPIAYNVHWMRQHNFA